jgi:hypothetical protein
VGYERKKYRRQPMKRLKLSELLEMFNPSVWPKIQKLALEVVDRKDALVVFECQALDSSHLGERTCVLVGPGHSIESVEEASQGWLGDLPSMRQYPVGYWQ